MSPPPSWCEGMCRGRGSRGRGGLASAKTPAWWPVARLAGVQAAGRNAAQLVAGGDVELGEHLVQVVLDRSRADEELGADVGIGKAVAGEPGDLCLLRGECIARVLRALACGFAGGLELATGALGEALCAHAAEQLMGGSELLARVDAPVLATQPFAVYEPRT